MTITADNLSSTAEEAPTAPSEVAPVVKPVRTRRAGTWLIGCAALILLGGLASVYVVQSVSNTDQVFVAKGDIARGETIEEGDLTTIEIAAGQSTQGVPESKLKDLVGTIAVVDIPAGSLLTKASVANALAVPEGKALVGITLQPGRLPAQSLSAGDHVVLVPVPVQGSVDVEAKADQTIQAVVSQVRPIENSVDVVVDVYVSVQAAPAVTSRSAAGALALYLAPGSN